MKWFNKYKDIKSGAAGAVESESAKDTILRLFDEMHDEAAKKGTAYNVDKFADALIASGLLGTTEQGTKP